MNAALIKLTEEKIGSNTALSAFIAKVKDETICLMPETVHFSDPALKFGAALVSVDINKDAYKNESGSYCLHLTKINEISQHLGIQITDSRILERKTDERGLVTFIEHQVRGRLKYVDGSIKEDVATGKYDYFRDREKYKSEGQIKGRRSHAEALAESNAKTRLFNKLNFKLQSSFTLEELKKPFLVPFIIEDKDELLKSLPAEDQAAIRKELVRQRLGIAGSIYQAPQNGNGHAQKEQEVIAEVIEAETIEPEEKGLSLEEKAGIDAETFREVNQKERTLKILDLVKKTALKNKSGAPITIAQVEKTTIDEQITFLTKLIVMANPGAESEALPL